jgi:hypothetical protein
VVGAAALLRGELPYTAFGDNKPPLICAYHAIAQLVAGRGIDTVRLVTTLIPLPMTAYAVLSFYRHETQGWPPRPSSCSSACRTAAATCWPSTAKS